MQKWKTSLSVLQNTFCGSTKKSWKCCGWFCICKAVYWSLQHVLQNELLCAVPPLAVSLTLEQVAVAAVFEFNSSSLVDSSRAEDWAYEAAGVSCREVKSVGTESGCNTEHSDCCFAVYFRGAQSYYVDYSSGSKYFCLQWSLRHAETHGDTRLGWSQLFHQAGLERSCTGGRRVCETKCQGAAEVLLLNECLGTNDLGLCYQLPWAVLL